MQPVGCGEGVCGLACHVGSRQRDVKSPFGRQREGRHNVSNTGTKWATSPQPNGRFTHFLFSKLGVGHCQSIKRVGWDVGCLQQFLLGTCGVQMEEFTKKPHKKLITQALELRFPWFLFLLAWHGPKEDCRVLVGGKWGLQRHHNSRNGDENGGFG